VQGEAASDGVRTQGPPAPASLEAALAAGGSPSASTAGAALLAPAGRSRRAPSSLRTRLLLLLAIGMLPALAGTAAYLQQLREVALREAYAQADLLAVATAEKLRWLLQDAQATLRAIAARPSVQALDAGSCDPVFSEFGKLNPAFKALSLHRVDGSAVCSELVDPPPADGLAAAPWFQAAVREPGFRVSGAHMGAVAGQWAVRITLTVDGPDGRPQGVLVVPLDLAELQQRLYARLPQDAAAAVLDGGDTVLVRSSLQAERVGKPAVAAVAQAISAVRASVVAGADAETAVHRFVEVGLKDVRRLFVARPVPTTDWVTVAALPESATLGDYWRTRDRTLAAIAGLLLVVGLAAAALSRGILRPMQGLARAARAVGEGDDSRRAPETGPREMVDVARDFNRMVQARAEAAQRLRASESNYRALIENLPVAVVTHRPDSAVELFNHRACELLRLTPEQMTGRLAQDRRWVLVDDQGRRLPLSAYPVTRLLQGRQALPPTVLGVADDGAVDPGPPPSADDAPVSAPHTWCMVTGYPQFDAAGVLLRVIVAFVDITAQRQGAELRLAKEAAEAASRAQSEFLSRVSHELRTPLNAINGFSELMLMDATLPPGVQHKARRILTAGKHLLSMINEILNLTQIESGRISATLRPVDLLTLAGDCLSICGPLAETRRVRLSLAPSAAVTSTGSLLALADETLLRQVLMNLLSNAIKYNREGGQVELVLGRLPAGPGVADLTLEVHDTGQGLSPQQLAGMFQPFNRLGAEFSSIEGHGLGLAISRLLAQAMGGEIMVSSEPGVGSCFTLRLRSAPASAGAASAGRPPTQRGPSGPPGPSVRA
jgi:signal transduction histidine kinase